MKTNVKLKSDEFANANVSVPGNQHTNLDVSRFLLLLLVPLLLTPFYDAVFNSEEPTSKFSTFVGSLFISFIWFFLWRSSGNKKEALCKEIYERWKAAEELKAEEK